MILEEIVTYEVAKLAKEKGFPQDVFGTCEMKSACYLDDGRFYKDGCICPIEEAYTAPTQSLLQRWLREEKGIHIIIDGGFQWGVEDLQRHFMDRDIQVEIGAFGLFDTYEEALHDALLYSLQNV